MNVVLNAAQSVGKTLRNSIINSLGAIGLVTHSASNLRALGIQPVRSVFFRQVYFTGYEALGYVTAIAVLIGVAIVTQVSNITGNNVVLTGRVLVWSVMRELGPLITAILVASRSSTAITSELGTLKVRREIDVLESMGIEPLDYLVLPRILGLMVSCLVLTIYFQIICIVGGFALSSFIMGFPFWSNLDEVFYSLSLFEIAISVAKSLAFGLLIAAVSCQHGLGVTQSITEIPRATSRAVVRTFLLLFFLDSVVTLVSFL